jgi:hypothetical protein
MKLEIPMNVPSISIKSTYNYEHKPDIQKVGISALCCRKNRDKHAYEIFSSVYKLVFIIKLKITTYTLFTLRNAKLTQQTCIKRQVIGIIAIIGFMYLFISIQ